MAQIAGGKGKAPAPFMLAHSDIGSDAVWHSEPPPSSAKAVNAKAARQLAGTQVNPRVH
jgi:hypothetical protein